MKRYCVGTRVRLSPEGRENECYRGFVGKVLRIMSVSTSREQHPGFDESAGRVNKLFI